MWKHRSTIIHVLFSLVLVDIRLFSIKLDSWQWDLISNVKLKFSGCLICRKQHYPHRTAPAGFSIKISRWSTTEWQITILKNYKERRGQITVKFHATDHGIDWNRFSLVLLFKEPRICFLIDIGVPLDMLGMLLKNWKKTKLRRFQALTCGHSVLYHHSLHLGDSFGLAKWPS